MLICIVVFCFLYLMILHQLERTKNLFALINSPGGYPEKKKKKKKKEKETK